MSRSLTTIYKEAEEIRDKYLEKYEIKNSSKMSILDAITWTTSAVIYSFETVMDVFVADIANILNGRINGTSAYYANALLKYQSGDELVINEDGTQFGYSSIDESKRIISKVSYQEIEDKEYNGMLLLLKIATSQNDSLTQIEADELQKINAYLHKIKFAGVKVKAVSRHGDILVPRITIYHDGALTDNEMYTNIENALTQYAKELSFDSSVYSSKIIDTIQKIDHVVDVYIDTEASNNQGIFIAQYDDNNKLGNLINIDRVIQTTSGYITESTRSGLESEIPTWRESITLKVE